jgi:hypothetical protein
VFFRPISQYGRVGHSGGPPSTIVDAIVADEPAGVVVVLPPPLLPELPQAASTTARHAVKASALSARGELRTGKSFRRFDAGVYQEVARASRRNAERGRRDGNRAFATITVKPAKANSLITTNATTRVTPAPTCG